MSLSIVHTRAALGVNAPPITVEVHISKGLPGLTMVGLPETTVKEARDRVRSAIINSGYEYPAKKNHHQPCSSRSAKRRGTI
ncbi:magnesium chelatase domain-containing protein [Escherichia coli]